MKRRIKVEYWNSATGQWEEVYGHACTTEDEANSYRTLAPKLLRWMWVAL